jgi:hypothetical protein
MFCWVFQPALLAIERAKTLHLMFVLQMLGCVHKKYGYHKSPSVVMWLLCLPLDPRFACSNPAEGDGFLRAIKIRSTPSLGEEVKASIPRKEPFEVWKSYFIRQNSYFFASSRALLPDCQRALEDESRVFSVDIIRSWFFMLIYLLGDEQ